MSEPRFLADEHIPRKALRTLRAYSVYILSATEAGLRSHPDEDYIELARREGRIIVSCDRDFSALHRTTPGHAGIILFPPSPHVGRIVATIRLIHLAGSAEEMAGRIEYW